MTTSHGSTSDVLLAAILLFVSIAAACVLLLRWSWARGRRNDEDTAADAHRRLLRKHNGTEKRI
jgi:nitrogen fixation-related uncharacterized protein